MRRICARLLIVDAIIIKKTYYNTSTHTFLTRMLRRSLMSSVRSLDGCKPLTLALFCDKSFGCSMIWWWCWFDVSAATAADAAAVPYAKWKWLEAIASNSVVNVWCHPKSIMLTIFNLKIAAAKRTWPVLAFLCQSRFWPFLRSQCLSTLCIHLFWSFSFWFLAVFTVNFLWRVNMIENALFYYLNYFFFVVFDKGTVPFGMWTE